MVALPLQRIALHGRGGNGLGHSLEEDGPPRKVTGALLRNPPRLNYRPIVAYLPCIVLWYLKPYPCGMFITLESDVQHLARFIALLVDQLVAYYQQPGEA